MSGMSTREALLTVYRLMRKLQRAHQAAEVSLEYHSGNMCFNCIIATVPPTQVQLSFTTEMLRCSSDAIIDQWIEQSTVRHEQPPLPYCSVCNEIQFQTPGGLSCPNGHGGAPTRGEEE